MRDLLAVLAAVALAIGVVLAFRHLAPAGPEPPAAPDRHYDPLP